MFSYKRSNTKTYKRKSSKKVVIVALALFVAILWNLNHWSKQLSSSTTPQQQPDTTSKTTSLAYEQSYGLFTDISNEDWLYRSQICRERRKDEHIPTSEKRNPATFFWSHYFPTFSCPHAYRIVDAEDKLTHEGKFTCMVHRLPELSQERKGQEGCLIYSVGSNKDFGWEDGINKVVGQEACEIHIFDPDITPHPRPNPSNYHYHKWGIKSSYDDTLISNLYSGEFKSLPATIKELKHDKRVIDILKVDCEGCEWNSYNDWIQHDIRQILIETHELPRKVQDAHGFFNDLYKAGYVLFSREQNGHPIAVKRSFVGYEWSFLKLHSSFCAV